MYAVYTNKESFIEENRRLKADLPFAEALSALHAPAFVGGVTVPNRLVCQAMEGCDGTADGSPDTLTVRRYNRFAEGGSGLIWFEATACCREGRANPRQLWLHRDNMDAFKRILEEIRETAFRKNGYAPIVIMQSTHSGRYSKPEGVPAPLIAYNNPLFEKDTPIAEERILSDDALDRISEQLAESARLAEQAGFDGVDIKCCHRYLNSELLSAYTRPGKYGGSFENRTRLLQESIRGAMENTGSGFIVSSRLNVYDGFPYPYGFGVSEDGSLDFAPEEPIRLLEALRDAGVALLNITMGNPYVNPHVNRPFAMGGYEPEEHPLEGVKRMLSGIAQLKKAVPEIALISSGLSFLGTAAPHVAAGFIEEGGFDFAGFGRMIFAYPDFARDILDGDGLKKDKICICCSKCTELMRSGGTPGCVVRDKLYTDLYKEMKRQGV